MELAKRREIMETKYNKKLNSFIVILKHKSIIIIEIAK
jgi:hypothetical protein